MEKPGMPMRVHIGMGELKKCTLRFPIFIYLISNYRILIRKQGANVQRAYVNMNRVGPKVKSHQECLSRFGVIMGLLNLMTCRHFYESTQCTYTCHVK